MTDRKNTHLYDVIGDVHGHADALTELLASMDYSENDGVWAHERRQAIFVGDLIDRGPKQVESVRIARSMVEAGSAQIVLGNHEFNAVAYATPDGRGGHLREHSDKNVRQHEAFIDAVGFGTPEHQEMIDWFGTIPLWLELGGLRVVHACWSDDHIDHLRPLVGDDHSLTDELLVAAHDKTDPSHHAIETILKGPEIALGNVHYLDKDGNRRDHARVAWWKERGEGKSVPAMIPSELLYVGGGTSSPVADDGLPPMGRVVYDSDIPVVFGHYWWTAEQGLTSERAVCVDFSVGKNRADDRPFVAKEKGELVAYRWDGETVLSEDKIHRAVPRRA